MSAHGGASGGLVLSQREACYELRLAAKRYSSGAITGTAWYAAVDAILTARGIHARAPQSAPRGAQTPPASATRTSTPPGSRPPGAGRNRERASARGVGTGGR